MDFSGCQAQLFVTEVCDLNCSGCPYPRLSRSRRNEIKLRELVPQNWEPIIDFLYGSGVRFFCIMGGEPCSYGGIVHVLDYVVSRGNTSVLLSTSGLHLINSTALRKSVSEILARRPGCGIAISFDVLPHSMHLKDSRSLKAAKGLELVSLLQEEYVSSILYTANVMVNADSLPQVLEIQSFLEEHSVYTNLCVEQKRCFGKLPTFSMSDAPSLQQCGLEMAERKLKGAKVVNSVSYLSSLAGWVGLEGYMCWEEPLGSPVLDVGPSGDYRVCAWIGQERPDGPWSMPFEELSRSRESLALLSKQTARANCTGCSWSRRDRGITPVGSLDKFSRDSTLLNLWTRVQLELCK